MANSAVLRALFRRFASPMAAALLAVFAAPALAHPGISPTDIIVSLHAEQYPLHQAARERDLIAIIHFFQSPHNKDVNAPDNYGDAPLHLAADSGFRDAVRLLVTSYEASVNVQNKHGQETPLHRAALKGHLKVVNYLLTNRADVNANNSDSPLHWAVFGGHANIVSVLLSNGANVNAQSPGGWTPLRHAARRPDSPVFAALLAAGGHYGQPCADGFSVNPAGADTPCICGAGRVEVSDLCEEVAVCDSPAARNAATNRCDCPPPNVGANGADPPGDCFVPSAIVCRGLTPRMTYDENLGECVCPNAETWNEQTGECECFAPDLRVNEMCPGLHLPAADGNIAAALTLIVRGADVNAPNADGDAPLHLAVKNGQAAAATLLALRGADVNLANADGDTPLHLAARLDDTAENAALITFLLNRGADPQISNNIGWIPLDLAYNGGGQIGWAARRMLMAALINGGAQWEDECSGGAIPNADYDGSPESWSCVCPPHIPERVKVVAPNNVLNHICRCPPLHSQVNGQCLPNDGSEAKSAEIAIMGAELAALWVELISLNARLSVLATKSVSASPPREDVEDMVVRAELARRGIERRRQNFIALTLTHLAGWEPPPVAVSNTEAECRKLGGRVRIHSPTGMRVCSGVDANDTFCLVYSGAAFPCRGLFRHVRQCNDDFNRRARNPFLCGKRCDPGKVATGKECR